MQVQVGLVAIAVNQHNPMNSYILLQEREHRHPGKQPVFQLPQRALPEHRDSISIVYDILRESAGISSGWIDINPQQVGLFDDVGRNPLSREIIVVYSLFVPEKLEIQKPIDYEWVKIDELRQHHLYLDAESIVRYTIVGDYKRNRGVNV